MQNFQDTFKTRRRLCISVFSICMTVPLTIQCELLFIPLELELVQGIKHRLFTLKVKCGKCPKPCF